MSDLVSGLISWDQELFLQTLFLSLDLASLENCTKVCQTWTQFLAARVFLCTRLRMVLEARLWEEMQAEHREVVVGGSVTSMVWDRKVIVCGYSDGSGEVLANNESGECIARLSDVEEGVHYTGSTVLLGKDVVIKIAYGSVDTGKIVTDLGVWSRSGGPRIFKSLLTDQRYGLYSRVVGNTLFIR